MKMKVVQRIVDQMMMKMMNKYIQDSEIYNPISTFTKFSTKKFRIFSWRKNTKRKIDR